jgi:hypothetical protein
MRSILTALIISLLVGTGQDTFRIDGVVRDSQGGALPGAEITLSGGRTVVTDIDGRFAFANLGPGSYEISARLAGFRAQTQRVHFRESSTVQVVFALSLAMLAEVLPIVPEPHDAYREADAIAHVRIVRTLPPLPCSGLGVVSAQHEATVLSELKGTLPSTVYFLQDSAGQCVEGSTMLEGAGERVYRPGSEYILFLVRAGKWYGRIAGGALAFPVREGSVNTHGFRDLPEVVSLDRFRLALQELAR